MKTIQIAALAAGVVNCSNDPSCFQLGSLYYTFMMMNIEDVWNIYSAEVLQYFKSKTGNAEIAADLRQDVFLKINESANKVRSEDKIGHWLRAITRNVLVDHYKNQSKTIDPIELSFGSQSDVDFKRSIDKCLYKMIGTLPEKYAIPLVRSDLEGVPQKQIAHDLGITVSGAKSRIQRSRKILRHKIDQCCKVELNSRNEIVVSNCEADSCTC